MRRVLAVVGIFIACNEPAVAHAQATATNYLYDSLGNRFQASGVIRLSASGVSSFQPAAALPDQPVNIFGRNLPVADPGGVSVIIGGVGATILSVAPNVMTIQVPQGAVTGSLVVTLPSQAPVDLGTLYIEGIVLTPRVALITFSQTVQFTADAFGVTDESVAWSLAPGTGCSASNNLGTISAAGLYTPPPTTDLNLCVAVLVKATSVELLRLKATGQVLLYGTTAIANMAQVLTPGVNTGVDLAMSPFVSEPPVSVLMPSFSDVAGDLPLNPAVAEPPVQILLPAFATEAGDLPMSPTTSNPPVEVDWQDNP